MHYQKTPSNTNRLFLYRNEFPENKDNLFRLLAFLGVLSIWGNYDENNVSYLSWELPKEITEEIIIERLNRLGCRLNAT